MARRDNHKLKNLSLPTKLVATAALLGGLGLFFSASFLGVYFTSFEFSAEKAILWGDMLARVHESTPAVFYALFGAHALSLVLILAVSNVLFARTAIPRGARIALGLLGGSLGALDLLAWMLLPYLAGARVLLGAVVALESLTLLYLIGKPIAEMWLYVRFHNREKKKVRVCIVGGGFAGLYTAMGLDSALGHHDDVEITVIDKKNYFLFPPLLPSVAAGAIETRQVTYPFRRIFEAMNVRFKKEAVERIDLKNKMIHARVDVDDDPETREIKVISSETPYDYLVLAPGSDTNTFGTKGVVEHAFFMRELGDAMAVRNHIIDCFEHAARDDNAQRRRELLCFVIVGAGPTGVELASEIRDLVAHVLLRRYPEIHAEEVKIHVVQSGNQILPGWHESIVKTATKQLATLEVDVITGARVVAVDAFSVTLGDGRRFESRTCVWCAGVKPNGLLSACDLPKEKGGRVLVENDCRVQGHSDVFVIGDAAYLMDKGKPLPPLGQVAFQQGSATADNLVRLIKGKGTRPFKYFNFGSLVSVGEHFAAIDLLGIRMSGFLAWIIWRTLYLMKLVGFSNRLRVVLDWTLDLLVERSISQISTSRQELRVEEVKQAERVDKAEKPALAKSTSVEA